MKHLVGVFGFGLEYADVLLLHLYTPLEHLYALGLPFECSVGYFQGARHDLCRGLVLFSRDVASGVMDGGKYLLAHPVLKFLGVRKAGTHNESIDFRLRNEKHINTPYAIGVCDISLRYIA